MKRLMLAGMCLTMVCSGGCATQLTPHAELSRAVTRSFDSSGFNYSSKNRVTHLSFPKQDDKGAGDKNMKFMGAALDIVRGFSVNMDGAYDAKNRKTEVLYDLHYDKDNVEVSIKLPLLIDYKTQTIYVGISVLNTVLDIVTPREADVRGKLIRINIPELMRELTERSPELAEPLDIKRFSPEKMEAVSNLFKTMVVKSITKLDDARFSDLPLTERDGQLGVTRRIQIRLGHEDTVTVILDLIEGVSQALYQQGIINQKEYSELRSLTDRRKISELVGAFELAMAQDVGVGHTGHVRYMTSRLDVADKERKFRVELENISEFDNYDAPRFNIKPVAGQFVDFREVLDALKTIKPGEHATSQPAAPLPDASGKEKNSPPENSQ